MRSLELPAGSILISAVTSPDGIYVVKEGLIGLFDRFDRILSVFYKGEAFGFESLYSITAMYSIKSLTFVVLEFYEPEEFKNNLDLDEKISVVKTLAKLEFSIRKRYDLPSEERMKDIFQEMKDMEVSNEQFDQIVVGLSLNDAMILESLRGEQQ